MNGIPTPPSTPRSLESADLGPFITGILGFFVQVVNTICFAVSMPLRTLLFSGIGLRLLVQTFLIAIILQGLLVLGIISLGALFQREVDNTDITIIYLIGSVLFMAFIRQIILRFAEFLRRQYSFSNEIGSPAWLKLIKVTNTDKELIPFTGAESGGGSAKDDLYIYMDDNRPVLGIWFPILGTWLFVVVASICFWTITGWWASCGLLTVLGLAGLLTDSIQAWRYLCMLLDINDSIILGQWQQILQTASNQSITGLSPAKQLAWNFARAAEAAVRRFGTSD